ncbi:MAG TPA: LuxR C-terminal-related transcriptional regulator [Chloroflexota bacterium]|nr:LuxR C-terminal-related transcriptional regulator [Chloroflexota bacterium]
MTYRSNNLPAHLPSLIGREEAVGSVREKLLQAERGVLTLTGTGGSGKTRIALAVATGVVDWIGFPDGVWLAELAPLVDPMLLAGVVAASVGIKEQPGRRIRDTLIDELQTRSLLLVLDNCEHLVTACAALADELLRSCLGLRILATSREPLRIPGERAWRVPPLPAPDAHALFDADALARNPAVQLFVERAQAVQSSLTLTAETGPAIAGICARLDGLPLAIELAAARARVLTPGQILLRLDDSFRLLVGGSRTAPTRQQTLRATLDWSYFLLSPSERERFERLAVFAGGFDLDGVAAIWSGDAREATTDELDVLTGLVDRSIVTAQPEAAGMRYRLLEPVRQYAQARLTERGAWEATCKQHAAYFVRLAEQAEQGLKGPDARAWVARLELEHDNLRAVLRRSLDAGEPEIPLRIGSALRNFWAQFGYRNEGRRWQEEAVAIEADLPPTVRANAVLTAAAMAHAVGDYRGVRTWFEQAGAYWREVGDPAALSLALGYYGRAVAATAQTPADYERGKALLHEAIAVCRETGTAWWPANAMLLLGISAWEHAELELAATILAEVEAILRHNGDTHGLSHVTLNLGGVLRDQGDLLGAQRLIEESLAVSRAINCEGGAGVALYYLAGLTRLQGDPVGAAQQALEGVLLQHRVGNISFLVNGVELLGDIACEQRLAERTVTLLSGAASIREHTGVPIPPILRPAYDRDLATARGAIGANRYAAVWAAGSAMTVDHLVEYASQPDAASAPPPTSPVDPLSQRERQVIALLARGFTNRQIAAELIISGRTADAHVAHILAKLDLSTRAQAAVWAVEHPRAAAPIGP